MELIHIWVLFNLAEPQDFVIESFVQFLLWVKWLAISFELFLEHLYNIIPSLNEHILNFFIRFTQNTLIFFQLLDEVFKHLFYFFIKSWQKFDVCIHYEIFGILIFIIYILRQIWATF